VPSLEDIDELLEKDPDDVFLVYTRAMLLKKEKGRDEETLTTFDRCLTLDPDYIPAYFQKGMFLAGLGEEDDAKEVLTKGIERAQTTGDDHARGEMEEFLDTL